MPNSLLLLGYAILSLSVLMWSIAPSFASRAAIKKKNYFSSKSFNAWRIAIAAIATLPPALYYGFPHQVPWGDWVFEVGVLVGGVVSTAIGDTLFVYSISRIGASLAIPVAYLFIIWSAIIDYATGEMGEKVFLAAFLALAGIWVSYTGGVKRDLKGLTASLLTSLVWAASIYGYNAALVQAQKHGFSPLAASIVIGEIRAVYTTLLMLPYLSIKSLKGIEIEAVASSLSGYVIGAITFVIALAFLAPSEASIGLALTPLLTQLLSSRIASEKITLKMTLGATLVAASIMIIYLA